MTLYCAGLLLDGQGRVVLVRKNRPKWQAGKLNAVGGHVEDGETPIEAQRREFREETGLDVPWSEWQHFATVSWGAVSQDDEPGEVWFFRAFRPTLDLYKCITAEDEPIEVHYTTMLSELPVIPNLKWLIPLAEYVHDRYRPLVAKEIQQDPVPLKFVFAKGERSPVVLADWQTYPEKWSYEPCALEHLPGKVCILEVGHA